MSQARITPDSESDDPYQPIRENREAVEQLAAKQREDSLAAWARVMLALADGEDPEEEDLVKTRLVPEGDW